MSQRVKRPNRIDDGSVPAKRRKRPATTQEEEEATSLASWRPINDLKIYNRTTTEAPAELFRKDLISAMKLPDSEPLALDEYWVIVDQWKQEWERGVQVPVNPDSLPEPSVTVTHCATLHVKPLQDFKLPKTRYIRITKDDSFNPEEHILSSAPAQAEAACSYDLDESDVAWLKIMNNERLAVGLGPLNEDQLERVIERLELRCWDKIQAILRNEEGLGIEYDENVICDVCRSPDSEEGNEMVFCDSCNICVHQACYGITRIPEGQWLCCTCVISQRPECVLCPNKGGAMKCTRSGQKWAHVSCALWIPEVSIGCVEKMEPITKISSIPQSRWALICVLCRERVGACIQCSVKTCKTAYHVTCAFKHGLEMRAIIEDENADDGVKLRSYCEKHSKSSKKEKNACSGSEDDDCKRKKRKDMTSEEKNQARAARSQEIEAEFYKHVCPKDIAVHIEVDSDALQCIYNYWKLKRKAGHNKPLLPPKSEDIDLLSHKQEQADIEKMKMFVQLRQDLERVRNLCYMVSRREKLSRTFFRMREQTFHKQVAVIQDTLAPSIIQAVIEANHGPSIYDKLYSHNNIDDSIINFDTMLARIAGLKSPLHESGDEKKPELNGLFKDVKNNPYKKLYFNGTSKTRNPSLYGSSLSSASSEEEKPKYNKENRLHSSSEEDKSVAKKKTTPIKNKLTEIRKKKQLSRSKLESSSEDDVKPTKRSWKLSKSRLNQVEIELGVSASDSDELMIPAKTNSLPAKKTISSIYSDSDSSDTSMKNDDKSSNAASDTQSQSRVRTKASVKEFSNKPSTSKSPIKSSPEAKKKAKEDTSKKEIKKKDYVQSDLIVPQRQAAKKATENIKSNTVSRNIKEQSGTSNTAPISEPEVKTISEKEEKEKVMRPKGKIGRPPKEKDEPKPKDKEDKVSSKKETKKEDIFDIDKEMEKIDQDIIAYVPQRQAAKKAAEHIKSGCGKPGTTVESISIEDKSKPNDENKTKKEHPSKKEIESKVKEKEIEIKLKEALKVSESKRKSTSSSASSSSSSSSDSTCTSSSDSEDERPAKQPQSESLSSAKEQTKRIGAKDWPFLDKAAKSAASSSSSDSSDSSRPSSPLRSKEAVETKESPRTPKQPARQAPNKSGRKSTDKKPTPPEREEPIRARGKGKSPKGRARTTATSDRFRDANVRTRDIPECNERERERSIARKGKQDELEIKEKENSKSIDKIFSPVRETEKKVIKPNIEPEMGNLEKEILERKAASNKPTNKSKFDALFGSYDNKECRPAKIFDKCKKSPQKENKDIIKTKQIPLKKSPIKSKCIEDIFANKLSNSINKTSDMETIISKKTNFNMPESKERLDKFNSLENEKKLENESKTINKSQSVFSDSNNSLKKSTTQIQSIFSPNPHNKDADILADINNMLVMDDGFGISKEEISKGPLSFSIGNSMLFKEDSKEDSARETLNLVEKLRMGLSKKSSVYDMDDAISVTSSTKNDSDRLDFSEQIVPNNVIESGIKEDSNKEPLTGPQINLEMRVEVMNAKYEEPNLYEKFVNCQNTMLDKNVPEVQQQHLDVTAPSDERWVPPSDSYPNLQGVDSKIFNEHNPESLPSYVQQYEGQFEKKLSEELLKNDSPLLHDRRITQTPYLDPASMDCMPSPSPYNDMHPQAKWAEHKVMPTRRSSSSSAISTASNCSKRNDIDEDLKRQEILMMNHPNHPINDGMSFGGIPQNLPFPPPSLEQYPQFSEASQFVSTPVSLFPSTNINTQIPFPSPGAAMFPPPFNTSFTTAHSVIPPLPKPMEDIHFQASACTAAFTSSQHNMALTAAMVNLPPVSPPPKRIEEKVPERPIPITPELPATPVEEIISSPALSNSTPNHVEPSPNPSLKSNTSSAGKKSPSKPTRTSARFINQQQNKSPSKSPGKSPRQEIIKTTASRNRESKKGAGKASTGRGTQSQSRGRGRGRGRGRNTYMQHDYDGNTIHNKLVGTVYDLDFDDDISNEMGDLRAMRERRKSVDVHERKTELVQVSRDSSESPKFTSPPHKGRAFNADLRELRPPTPINEEPSKSESPEPAANDSKTFPSIVTPVLPGPVDMRTYNSTFDPQHFNDENLLGAFGTGATEQPVHEELDELLEKELRSAISGTGHNKRPIEPHVPEVSNIKVSLSDSRNQLKVKIKGPISNYTSTVAPLPPASDTTVSNLPINSVVNNTMSNSGVGINSGTSTNLRRMRKKELLRQYWTQDMNMDDPTPAPGYMSTPVAPSINRTIITIPKAVASMTSIPTKEDYRDYRTGVDDIFETKVRKEKPSRPVLSRELRQLDITMDDGDNSIERRRSIGSNNSNSNLGFESNNKRRGRPPRHTQYPTLTQEGTPKLKIKISGNSIVGGGKIDDKRDRIRPPKKRLSASVILKPTVEDLKRESMKFRKQVMADFGEEKKEKKKKDKSNKKSKKKKKQEVQIIANEGSSSATPKLIIRFGKKTDTDRTSKPEIIINKCQDTKSIDNISNKDSERTEVVNVVPDEPVKVVNSVEKRTNKVIPIKLKLSRCQEGSGYVMKKPPEENKPPDLKHQKTSAPATTNPSTSTPTLNLSEPPSLPVHAATPLPLNKDCEVR